MPEATGRIFISIGVSKPGGGLDQLPGAITAAERMAAWAEVQGYTTLLIHDGDLPEITVDLLRNEISAAIRGVTNETELKRLVIFFAGHGAALAIGDQYWILTNWQKRSTEAIKVSSLQRMLEYYGPKQVSVIGDACQEFSSKFIDLIGSAVLDKPDEDQRPYELDQFFAVDTGKQAFMIKAQGEKKDFCVFTEVLLDALEGDAHETQPEAGNMVVTSQSLARYLADNVAREAGKYGVRMIPRPKPGFYTDRVYLAMPIPPGAEPPAERRGTAKKMQNRSRSVRKARLVPPKSPSHAVIQQSEVLNKAREARRDAFVIQFGDVEVRDHFETGCGICVSGADVVKVEASFGKVSAVDEDPKNWFRIELKTGNDSLGWSDAFVTLADGRIVSVCAVNGFVAALQIVDADSVSLFHRPLGDAPYEGKHAIDLLAQAHAGLLDRDTIIETATNLRYGKHRIITLGCIAAQFYDAIRDVDSLRSMAAFYAIHKQPIPLDIVLYGGGKIIEDAGHLYADVPAVAAREPRTPQEGIQRFTCEATPECTGHPIAGRIPWMRHAWGAVATAKCDESAESWREHALAAMAYLAPGPFTTVRPGGRDAFLELAGMPITSAKFEAVMTT